MKSTSEIIQRLSSMKTDLQQQFGITDLGIFGSYVREEQKPESDIDVYVDYHETPSLLDIVDLENFLSDTLNEKVDVVPRECIRPELEKYILPEIIRI